MARGRTVDDEQEAGTTREERQPRRPWALVAACLILVVLTTVLWVKWSGARREAAKLQKELTKVYKEAEDLRLQEALGRERIGKLEREVRALLAERERQAKPADDKVRSGKPAQRR